MDQLLFALNQALQPQNFIIIPLGLVIGIIAGAIPGITASMAIVLSLPLTYRMEPTSAFSLLIGIFIGAMAGGSIASILINIPGNPAAVITGADGHPMAKNGESGKAIFVAFYASALGSLVSFVPLFTIAPLLANVALGFHSPELFSIVLLGLVIICFLSEGSLRKSLISCCIGLLVMTIGLDRIESSPRFTFGTMQLQYGVDVLPVMVGLFAIPQIFEEIRAALKKVTVQALNKAKWLPSIGEMLRVTRTTVIGSLIGVGIGITPGTGSAVAAVFSYQFNKKISKHPEKFGTGIVEGVAAPESANNGMAGGALIPMLTLGIPGDPVTAVMLGALTIQGLNAGPLLFRDHAHVVYGMFGSYLIASVLLLFIGVIGMRLYVKALAIPKQLLFPLILIFCVVGSFSLRNSFFDVWIMFLFGLLGYFMKLNDYPNLPLLIAIVLGPALETNLRMTLLSSGGNPMIFVERRLTLVLLIVSALVIAYRLLCIVHQRKKYMEIPA